jgi:hypothetical protein
MDWIVSSERGLVKPSLCSKGRWKQGQLSGIRNGISPAGNSPSSDLAEYQV